jgi:NADP-dependent 3-hydroxy acid dehydrogenase YdfG
MFSESIAGRVALVTGASSGIGATVARRLLSAGVLVAAISRHPEPSTDPHLLSLSADVRDASSMENAVSLTLQAFGGLDIVVANAGVGSWGPVEDTPLAEVDEMIDINVKGLINTVRAALPLLRQSRVADIVTIASEAGRRALPDEAVYVASKFAQLGFTRSIDHELRAAGIRCVNICPGGVATEFGMGRGLREPDMPELKNMMRPDDVTDFVEFALTRPRHLRVLEVAFRHVSESSWG